MNSRIVGFSETHPPRFEIECGVCGQPAFAEVQKDFKCSTCGHTLMVMVNIAENGTVIPVHRLMFAFRSTLQSVFDFTDEEAVAALAGNMDLFTSSVGLRSFVDGIGGFATERVGVLTYNPAADRIIHVPAPGVEVVDFHNPCEPSAGAGAQLVQWVRVLRAQSDEEWQVVK